MIRTEIVNEYVKTLKYGENKSEHTIRNYMRNVNEFLDWLEENEMEVEDVKSKDIKIFRSIREMSKSSMNLRINAVNHFFNFLVEDMEMLDKNPCDKVKSLKIRDKVEEQPLTKEQIYSLIDNCKNIRDKCIIEMLVNTGLRISELINVTLSDFKNAKQNDGELLILGKGSKLRTIYLNDKLMNDLDKYVEIRKESNDDNLFISNYNHKMDASCINRTLKTIAKRSGMFTDEEANKIHNHLLRHTYTTIAIESDIPLEVVSKTLGHSSTNITYQVYLHQSKNRIKETMKNFKI